MIPPLLPILIWPLVTTVFFKRYGPGLAMILTILGGKLILPPVTSLDLPLLPPLTKETIPVISAWLIGGLIVKSQQHTLPKGAVLPGFFPKNKLILGLLVITLFGSFMTVLANGDPLIFTRRVIPGLRPYDAFSVVMSVFFVLLPMLLARKYLARPEDHRLLLVSLCVGGLNYSLLTLFEARMAPQLNIWFYGFFAHDWQQHVRGGQFRPLVFQSHGLVLGIFLAITVIASAILSRTEKARRGKLLFVVFWLFAVLFVSRNLGAFLIAAGILPVALFLSTRTQLLVASILGAMILLYPMLRGAGFIPIDFVTQTAEQINVERAASLQVRLSNEDSLLEKARQRPFWGWGSWGRNLVYNTQGDAISIIDGAWIIVIGFFGWVGYIGQFGLLVIPTLLIAFGKKKTEITLVTSGLALLMSVNLIDLIPNSALTPLTWMMAGALIGRLELSARELEPEGLGADADGSIRYARARPGGRYVRGSKPPVVQGRSGYAQRPKTGAAR